MNTKTPWTQALQRPPTPMVQGPVIFLAILGLLIAGCLGGQTPSEEDSTQPTSNKTIIVTIDAIPCPEGFDNLQGDDVCLAYNGEIPGPTWVFQEGDSVKIELRHNVTKSIASMEVDDGMAQRLSDARYSLHHHGLMLDACSDGVMSPEGTHVCDSTVGPGESVTYTFSTPFPGAWHYHDHTSTGNAEPKKTPVIGEEASLRGLFGSFLVAPSGYKPDHVFNLHLIDAWSHDDEKRASANGGLGLDEKARVGDRFNINVVGLGDNHMWRVTLHSPNGEIVDEVDVGPGVSRPLAVEKAEPGSYTWTARWIYGIDAFDTLMQDDTGPILEGAIKVDASDANPAPSEAQRPTVLEGKTINGLRSLAPTYHPSTPMPRDVWGKDAFSSPTGERAFVLTMDANRFNGESWPDTPLLEASVGERLHFAIIAGFGGHSNGHTFHIHGHPWLDPETNEFIDTVLLPAGETHLFDVVAGLDAGHTGDWIYHCHMTTHFMGGMWGILRVYEHNMNVRGPLHALNVMIQDADGAPIEGATIEVRWNPDAPADPSLASTQNEQTLPATVTHEAGGTYTVRPDLPTGATGELVIQSTHETGNSLVRLTLQADGFWEENRDVGLSRTPIGERP